MFGAAINCGSEETGKFIEGDGGCSSNLHVSVKPNTGKPERSICTLVKNMTDQEQELQLHCSKR